MDSLTTIKVEPNPCPSHQFILFTWNFGEKYWELVVLKNSVSWATILEMCFQKNCSSLWKLVSWLASLGRYILMIIMVSSPKICKYATQCKCSKIKSEKCYIKYYLIHCATCAILNINLVWLLLKLNGNHWSEKIARFMTSLTVKSAFRILQFTCSSQSSHYRQ